MVIIIIITNHRVVPPVHSPGDKVRLGMKEQVSNQQFHNFIGNLSAQQVRTHPLLAEPRTQTVNRKLVVQPIKKIRKGK